MVNGTIAAILRKSSSNRRGDRPIATAAIVPMMERPARSLARTAHATGVDGSCFEMKFLLRVEERTQRSASKSEDSKANSQNRTSGIT
jgi:hypothetical protein